MAILILFVFLLPISIILPSVLRRCWLGGRKGVRPVKTEWLGAGVVVCLQQGADLHMAQLMPLPLIVSCFSEIQIGFTFLVPAHPGSPGKRAVKQVCVCVYIHMSFRFHYLNHSVANRMAPCMCLDPCGTRWGSWFRTILYIFPPHIWCSCGPYIF